MPEKISGFQWVSGAAIVLAAALILLLAARHLPMSTSEEPLIPHTETPYAIEIPVEGILVQSLKLPAGRWSGLAVFAHSQKPIQSQVKLEILDSQGHILRRGQANPPQYLGENEVVQLVIPFRPIASTQTQAVQARFTVTKQPLQIYASLQERDIYTGGTVTLSNEDLQRDIALSLLYPTPLSFAAQQGVTVGVILMLSLFLITRLPPRHQWWGVAGVLIAITPLALLGYWYGSGVLGIADWDYYFSLHHYYREIILTHHSFPLWNPYTCGGTAGLADPEFPGFTPTFALEMIFGIPTGLRLAIWLSTAVGALGMLALARRLERSLLAGTVAALAVAFGTVNLLEITEGHVNVFAVGWIPWIFWAWLGAYRNPRPRTYFVTALFLALTFLQGGIYLLMYTTLALSLLAFLTRRPWRAWKVTLIAGTWALGLVAVKLIPVLLWLYQFPDQTYTASTYTLPWLLEILFGRHVHETYLIFNQGSGWHEYGAYLGYFVAGLSLIGAAGLRKNRIIRSLLIATVLAIVLSTAGPGLRPLFDQLWFFPRSNISRVILFAVIPAGLLAAFGLDRLRQKLALSPSLIIIIVGIIAADLFSLAYPVSQQAFVLPEVVPPPAAAPAPIAFTTQRFDDGGAETRTTRAYAAARAGYGVIVYCSVLGPSPRALTIYDTDGTHYLSASRPDVQAALTHWSPNSVVVEVNATETTVLALNTNFVEGWEVTGAIPRQVDGRLAATVDPGSHLVRFRYQAPGFILGVAVTIGSLLISIYAVARDRTTHTTIT